MGLFETENPLPYPQSFWFSSSGMELKLCISSELPADTPGEHSQAWATGEVEKQESERKGNSKESEVAESREETMRGVPVLRTVR